MNSVKLNQSIRKVGVKRRSLTQQYIKKSVKYQSMTKVVNNNSFSQQLGSFNPFSVSSSSTVQQTREVQLEELPKLGNQTFEYASYEQNCQAIKFNKAGLHVLIDPWFIGDLNFFGVEFIAQLSKAVFKPSRKEIDDIFNSTDLIVLSQDYDDHCHMPTLKEMPKTIPVVANEKAAKRIKPLGFQNVTIVDFGETVKLFDGKLSITGTEGALTGPPPPLDKRQNGYIFREMDGVSIYYEPHCDRFWPEIKKFAPVDVVITQAVTTSIFGYILIGGLNFLAPTIKALQAKKFVPLRNTIDVFYLATIFKSPWFTKGNEERSQEMLKSQGVNVHVQNPVVGQFTTVNV